ncbi:MAG: GDP-mannose 4,6-dehydratase, partial [Thermodesulfobacteriota bacterium]|nr:GDP-mannose 4,6-dehydratase [Thermodesulfobacteriota bacterium]
EIINRITFIYLDYGKPRSIKDIFERNSVNEVYNFASQSHVGQSWGKMVETFDSSTMITVRIINEIHNMGGGIKYFQASSCVIFGTPEQVPQVESTSMQPDNPYGLAKYSAHQLVRYYRERYDYFLCSGIFYNHESPRRTLEFVSRKITNNVAKIKLGKLHKLELGNLDSIRDWGYAPDYVEGAWMMLQADKSRDYILATGKGHTVKQFVEEAFNVVGLDYKKYLCINKSLFRSNDTIYIGNPCKIKSDLGWYAKTTFKELINIMVESDINVEKQKEV